MHHFVGEAVFERLKDYVGALYPLGIFEFAFVHLDGFVAYYVAVEANEDVAGDAPGLGFVVADIGDGKTDFFHNFSCHALLKCLTDLGKARNKGVVAIADTVLVRTMLSVSLSVMPIMTAGLILG